MSEAYTFQHFQNYILRIKPNDYYMRINTSKTHDSICLRDKDNRFEVEFSWYEDDEKFEIMVACTLMPIKDRCSIMIFDYKDNVFKILEWLTKSKLNELIEFLNRWENFYAAYGWIVMQHKIWDSMGVPYSRLSGHEDSFEYKKAMSDFEIETALLKNLA